MLKCTKCLKLKESSEFGLKKSNSPELRRWCIQCCNLYKKQYYERNKEKYIEYAELHKDHIKKYKTDNHNKRLKTDPNYKISKSLRNRFKQAVKKNYKSGSAVRDLGCSINNFKLYLESKFQPGMTWDNHGKWHIDHIKPLINFNLSNREQLLKAVHYTNLQPLWAYDNLSKGAK